MPQPSPPTVSVVITTYNGVPYLERSLASVLSQSYPLQEVLVVDDGSTDGTPDFLASRFPQVTVVTQENAGQCAAINHGLSRATGEFVALLDHDDEWLPGKLEKQVPVLQDRPDIALLLTLGLRVPDAAPLPPVPAGSGAVETISFREFFHWRGRSLMFGPSSWLLRRAVFDSEWRGFAQDCMPEQDALLRLAALGHRVALLHEFLWVYRNRLTSVCPGRACQLQRVKVVPDLLRPFDPCNGGPPALLSELEYRRGMQYEFKRIARMAAAWGEDDQARALLREAARYPADNPWLNLEVAIAAALPGPYFFGRRLLRRLVGHF